MNFKVAVGAVDGGNGRAVAPLPRVFVNLFPGLFCAVKGNFGQVLAEGEANEVLNNPEVIKAYLGDD